MAKKTKSPAAAKNQGSSSAGTKARTKHPVIHNSRYPTTEEVGRWLGVPAKRVRELKALAKEIAESHPFG